MYNIAFSGIDWEGVDKVEHLGETGTSFWQTVELNGFRVRIVEYSENYLADHWCEKGHIVHCLEGAFANELEDGEKHIFEKGMSYVVSDGKSTHRSTSRDGAKLLIVDGGFLKPPAKRARYEDDYVALPCGHRLLPFHTTRVVTQAQNGKGQGGKALTRRRCSVCKVQCSHYCEDCSDVETQNFIAVHKPNDKSDKDCWMQHRRQHGEDV